MLSKAEQHIMAGKKSAGERPSAIPSKGMWGEAVVELKKVSTPTRQETVQATVVTVVIILAVGICLALLDLLFNNLMQAILV